MICKSLPIIWESDDSVCQWQCTSRTKETNKNKQTNKQTNKQKRQINMMISIAKTCTYFSIHAPFPDLSGSSRPFPGKRYEEDPGGCGGGQCSGSFCHLDHTRNKKHMCQGLNSLYFHIIGDGHQPNSRDLYTLAHMFVFFCVFC